VADEHAGKRAKCPACGMVQMVPWPWADDASGPTELPEPDGGEELPASLKRAVPPIPAIAAPEPAPVDRGHGGNQIRPPDPSIHRVILIDADMPISSMMILAIKWAFASIPAIFLMGLFWGAVYWVATQMLIEQGARR
jgi:hypothetical protein